MIKTKTLIFIGLCVAALASCERNDIILKPESEQQGEVKKNAILGFYLLNEGNMGSNKATLDYYDYTTATYTRNIYAAANPNVAQELGDVGNDIAIYGNKLYAVINCSNFVEVMDAYTAKHLGTIQVPNCRYLCFDGQYGYLTSYAGPVQINPDYEQIGYVAKFDTATLEIVDTCHVGFQPDDLEIVGNKLYVANSGGYMVPNYENTVSVIDLATFKEIKRIEVVNNLHRLCVDKYNQLWVTSRGDYYEQPSRLYCIDVATDSVIDSVSVAVSNFCLDGDTLYLYGTEWSYISMDWNMAYGMVNVKTHELLTDNFIKDETVSIKMPYGIKVNPFTKDIYLTDAKNYVTPGTLWCIGQDGKAKWSVRTGDIPAHMVFLYNKSTK